MAKSYLFRYLKWKSDENRRKLFEVLALVERMDVVHLWMPHDNLLVLYRCHFGSSSEECDDLRKFLTIEASHLHPGVDRPNDDAVLVLDVLLFVFIERVVNSHYKLRNFFVLTALCSIGNKSARIPLHPTLNIFFCPVEGTRLLAGIVFVIAVVMSEEGVV